MDFNDLNAATRMRSVVESVVKSILTEEHPAPILATVATMPNVDTGICDVIFPGDTEPSPVRMGFIKPTAIGQTVRLAGKKGARYIIDVLSTGPTVGQLYFHQDDERLYVRNEDGWVCITPIGASVYTDQTIASATYGDLGTVGPSVSLLTGTKAQVRLACGMYNGVPQTQFASFAVSGATTRAPLDDESIQTNSTFITGARLIPVTGLTPGVNVFTMKYRRLTSGTVNFLRRDIEVVGIP